ncbi:hypothetical protein AB0J68_07505, partial [Micromonospora sp. NPDC049580]
RPGPAAFARIYPGETGARVRRLWKRYDPDGVFRSPLLAGQSTRSGQSNRSGQPARSGQRSGQPHRRRR